MSERSRYWICLLALVGVLPLAIVVNAWDSLREAWSANEGSHFVVESGASRTHGGAVWRLADMKRLPGSSKEARIVLAALEALPDDPSILAQTNCVVRLVDAEGRRWEPLSMTEPTVRETYPEIAERPRCSALAFAGSQRGNPVKMVESFVVPANARDLSLSVEFTGAGDDVLLFKWTSS
ncbi:MULTISPECIES: hypothetical protein [unclassified Sinorhizobium]|uniref:hypothetical protein n=1 Tax=unclassified Sinorhizobium TaxID=2613772 RepID=UPI0024C3F958|nr:MULTISPECIES: hypothetical protein [unclassified Sinorhizobium]MDK1374346.1 hypothetical protein [Sinorhizobium sp. 6-70]MDK1482241.1 hypothetical protein [Sinorhizobium sp. 6-117]